MKLEISSNKLLLLQPTKKFDFRDITFNIVDFAQSLVDLMLKENGFGLAANQVGYSLSIFAMRGEPENFVFINPRLVNIVPETNVALEGCLSYKGLAIKISRSNEVRVRFQGPDAQTYTKVFKGLTARVVQHEMSHLEGRVWWDQISKLKFDMAVRNAKKRGWDFSKLTYKGI